MGKRFIGSLVVLGMALAACGGDDDGGGDAADTEVQSTAGGGDTSNTGGATGDTGAGQEEPHDPDGVLRMAYDLVASTRGGFHLDPAASGSSTGDLGIYHLIYGGLMRKAQDGTLVPDLAESMNIVDANTIEVVLRDGLTLSDGSPFDAQLVKQSLERNLAQEGKPAFGGDFFKLSSVEVVDPTTVRLTIPDGGAAGWADQFMAGAETVPVPPDTNFQKPVAAGPYTVAEFVPEERLVLEKNPEYWDAESFKLAGIEITNAPGAQAQVAALNADQVDWTALDAFTMDAVGDQFELLTPTDPNFVASIIICKKGDGPLADPQFRQALSMAIDRQALSDAFFGGEADPAWDLWPVDHRFHNPDLTEAHAYDPEAARQLLEDAGYGDGVTFEGLPIPSGGSPQIAQVVQQQWAEIGVTMELSQSANFVEDLYIKQTTPVGFVPSLGAGGIGKLRQWVGDSIGNMCGYSDPELNELAAELKTVSAESDRAVELWHQINAIAVRDTLSILLLHQPRVVAFNAEVLGGDATSSAYTIPFPEVRELYVKQ